MDTLKPIKIQRADNGKYENASIVRLGLEDARKMIDETWWKLLDVSPTDIKNEGDSHWKWEGIARNYSSSSVKDCLAILSKDDYIEGAVAYRLDALSALAPPAGCAYIGWLATAPHNRNWLSSNPLYKGIGSKLVYWVVRESYNAALEGRISLKSLTTASTIGFYIGKGCVRTNPTAPSRGLIDFELPKPAAEAWLRKEGDL